MEVSHLFDRESALEPFPRRSLLPVQPVKPVIQVQSLSLGKRQIEGTYRIRVKLTTAAKFEPDFDKLSSGRGSGPICDH